MRNGDAGPLAINGVTQSLLSTAGFFQRLLFNSKCCWNTVWYPTLLENWNLWQWINTRYQILSSVIDEDCKTSSYLFTIDRIIYGFLSGVCSHERSIPSWSSFTSCQFLFGFLFFVWRSSLSCFFVQVSFSV